MTANVSMAASINLRAAVLCYHSTNVNGHDYARNDHVALQDDLRALLKVGVALCSLGRIVSHIKNRQPFDRPTVAISFDDGCIMDACGFDHPTWGPQPGFLAILEEQRDRLPMDFHASSFVIASPEARRELDQRDFLGLNVWGDHWWASAHSSGFIRVENHSWDHNHPSLSSTAMRGQGRFDGEMSLEEAHAEIVQASDYIAQRVGRAPRYFAYPWGQVNPFLHQYYFPRMCAQANAIAAAFTTAAEYVDPLAADRWAVPRFVCGADWRSTDEFARLIAGLGGVCASQNLREVL